MWITSGPPVIYPQGFEATIDQGWILRHCGTMTIQFSPTAISQLSCVLTSPGCANTLGPSLTAEAVEELIRVTFSAQRLRARHIDQHVHEVRKLGRTFEEIDHRLARALEG